MPTHLSRAPADPHTYTQLPHYPSSPGAPLHLAPPRPQRHPLTALSPALSSILPRWPAPPLRSSAASSTSTFMPAAGATAAAAVVLIQKLRKNLKNAYVHLPVIYATTLCSLGDCHTATCHKQCMGMCINSAEGRGGHGQFMLGRTVGVNDEQHGPAQHMSAAALLGEKIQVTTGRRRLLSDTVSALAQLAGSCTVQLHCAQHQQLLHSGAEPISNNT